MKKLILLLFISFITLSIEAQLVADRTQYTCDSKSENVFDVLKSGKILMVCMQGLDCGGCRAGAPAVDTFATNNKNTVRVWGALNKINGGGTCSGIADWKTDFGYNDIFTFLDSTKYWEKTYGAEFVIFNPKDFKVYFKSFDASSAIAKANELNDIIAGVSTTEKKQVNVYPNPTASTIQVSVNEPIVLATITDALGKSETVIPINNSIDVSTLKQGIYFLHFTNKRGNTFYAKFSKE